MKIGMPAVVVIILGMIVGNAKALTYTTETIVFVCTHINGNIYFKSLPSCPNGWCVIAGTSDLKKSSLAMLMTGYTMNLPVGMAWEPAAPGPSGGMQPQMLFLGQE